MNATCNLSRLAPLLLTLFCCATLQPTPASAQDNGNGNGNGQAARQAEDDLEQLLRRFGPGFVDLKPKIDAAIEHGVAFLLGEQLKDGSWKLYADDANNALGGTALCALAVRKSMIGLYEGSERDLKKEIRTLERKERTGAISYADSLRLKHLRANGENEVKRREAMEKSVERALFWIRVEYAKINKQITFKLPDNTQCPPHRTYTLGVILMLLEAYYTERQQVAEGYVMGVNQRRVPAADLDWIREMVAFLERFAVKPTFSGEPEDKDDDAEYQGKAWRYPAGLADANVDHSATQYAILGLKAAARMGVTIKDASLWEAVATYFLSVQMADGEVVQRKPPAVNPGNGESFFPERYTKPQPEDRARGWSYLSKQTDPHPVTGGMTCAALAALALARSELLDAGVLEKKPDLASKIERSMADGMAWLGHKFKVDGNPHEPTTSSIWWHYYYLYGLERAGVLCRTEHFGIHPWYPTGAKYLCEKQRDDASSLSDRTSRERRSAPAGKLPADRGKPGFPPLYSAPRDHLANDRGPPKRPERWQSGRLRCLAKAVYR